MDILTKSDIVAPGVKGHWSIPLILNPKYIFFSFSSLKKIFGMSAIEKKTERSSRQPHRWSLTKGVAYIVLYAVEKIN